MRRLLAFLPLAVLGAIALPVIVSPVAATAFSAPAACLPVVASAPLFASAPVDGALGGGDEAQADAAEPTMERAIDRAFVATVVGQPAGKPLVGAELETRTHEVGLLLRCPVCQGSSVADSPSSTAINMKNEVRDLLAQGYDQRQILDWFEASYGQFVLMEPKAEGLNMLVWLGPGVVLLAGLALVALHLRRSMGGEVPEDAEEAPAADPELDDYLREARALAFGADGDRPADPNESRHGKV